MESSLQAPVMMWGIYPWLPELGIERIHPNSRSRILEDSPYGRVFKLLDTDDGDWVQLEGATGKLKVTPDLFLTVPRPKFIFGQDVRTLPPRSPRLGRITDIRWHDQEKRIFYQIECDSRQLPGHYWDNELESTSEQAAPESSLMLALDSPAWSALEHAYGTAGDIPDLLRDLESFPPDVANDDGTWHALWSALCHQSDVYAASFAAVPHIVRLAVAAPDRITPSFILLPTCIEASRLFDSTLVPADLAEAYFCAVASLPEIVAACFGRDWDSDFARTASAALCAAKGHGGLAYAILDLSEDVLEEFSGWVAAEWQRKHTRTPGPPPSIQIQPPSSTSST